MATEVRAGSIVSIVRGQPFWPPTFIATVRVTAPVVGPEWTRLAERQRIARDLLLTQEPSARVTGYATASDAEMLLWFER